MQIQLSSKSDIKEICKNVKLCHSSHTCLENIVVFHKYMLSIMSYNVSFKGVNKYFKKFFILISDMGKSYSCNPHQ